jgi:5'-nucleotidase
MFDQVSNPANVRADGYTSLLIEEEGGTAKEVVSEENGVLISTILRQYFMSLKVLGKWKYWGKSMDRKFSTIQTDLQGTHKLYNASPTSPTTQTSLPAHPKFPSAAPEHARIPRHHSINKVLQQHARDESPGASDSEQDPDTDEEDYDDTELIKFNARELVVLRKSMAKWWRLAGLKGTSKCADEIGEAELKVDWTKAIAPRVEGRIKEVGNS